MVGRSDGEGWWGGVMGRSGTTPDVVKHKVRVGLSVCRSLLPI